MSETASLKLPLLQPSQAQKHVTVNEALSRLDAAVQMTLISCDQVAPPQAVVDGQAYGVASGAVNEWAGAEGSIAVAQNGGWVFMTPQAGWRAFVTDRGAQAIHDGIRWHHGALTMSRKGAGMAAIVHEIDHVITAGTSNLIDWPFLRPVMVIGVTARVIENLAGTAQSWTLGTVSAQDRFGNGLGIQAESWCRGLLTQPTTQWSPEPLQITAIGGAFASGRVRLAIHAFDLMIPEV